MEDLEFFDYLYQGWSKTTGAEDTFWMPEESKDLPGAWDILSVDQNQERRLLAALLTEADAAFITAVHGCFGDLVRRIGEAVDTAERLDCERDQQEARIAELTLELIETRNQRDSARTQRDSAIAAWKPFG
jgi:hypothetical protein